MSGPASVRVAFAHATSSASVGNWRPFSIFEIFGWRHLGRTRATGTCPA